LLGWKPKADQLKSQNNIFELDNQKKNIQVVFAFLLLIKAKFVADTVVVFTIILIVNVVVLSILQVVIYELDQLNTQAQFCFHSQYVIEKSVQLFNHKASLEFQFRLNFQTIAISQQ
jgi:hypothetical protein